MATRARLQKKVATKERAKLEKICGEIPDSFNVENQGLEDLMKLHQRYGKINRKLMAHDMEEGEEKEWLSKADLRYLNFAIQSSKEQGATEEEFKEFLRMIDMSIEDDRTCLIALNKLSRVITNENINICIKFLETREVPINLKTVLEVLALGVDYPLYYEAISACSQHLFTYFDEVEDFESSEELASTIETITLNNP